MYVWMYINRMPVAAEASELFKKIKSEKTIYDN